MTDLNKISEIQILYKNRIPVKDRIKMINSTKVKTTVRPYFENCLDHHEEIRCLYMNRASQALGMVLIGIGGINGVISDPKIIFQDALKLNASSLILVHNHPSGNPEPSENDKLLTKKVKEGCEILDLNFLDHLIIAANNACFSFADNCML